MDIMVREVNFTVLELVDAIDERYEMNQFLFPDETTLIIDWK